MMNALPLLLKLIHYILELKKQHRNLKYNRNRIEEAKIYEKINIDDYLEINYVAWKTRKIILFNNKTQNVP